MNDDVARLIKKLELSGSDLTDNDREYLSLLKQKYDISDEILAEQSIKDDVQELSLEDALGIGDSESESTKESAASVDTDKSEVSSQGNSLEGQGEDSKEASEESIVETEKEESNDDVSDEEEFKEQAKENPEGSESEVLSSKDSGELEKQTIGSQAAESTDTEDSSKESEESTDTEDSSKESEESIGTEDSSKESEESIGTEDSSKESEKGSDQDLVFNASSGPKDKASSKEHSSPVVSLKKEKDESLESDESPKSRKEEVDKTSEDQKEIEDKYDEQNSEDDDSADDPIVTEDEEPEWMSRELPSKYNPFITSKVESVRKRILQLKYYQNIFDRSIYSESKDYALSDKQIQRLVDEVTSFRSIKSVTEQISRISDVFKKYEDYDLPPSPKKYFGKVTAILGAYLLKVISPSSGCTDIDFGCDVEDAGGNNIVILKDFPLIYCGFSTVEQAQNFCIFVKEFLNTQVIKGKSSIPSLSSEEDIFEIDEDEYPDVYDPIKDDYEDVLFKCLDQAQMYQVYEDYLDNPTGISYLISRLRDRLNGSDDDDFEIYSRSGGSSSRYGNSRNHSLNRYDEDLYGRKKRGVFSTVGKSSRITKGLKSKKRVNAIVRCKTVAKFFSIVNKYYSSIPRKVLKKAYSGKLYYDEHFDGLGSLMGYKALQLCLSEKSGITAILLGDSQSVKNGRFILEFTDFCELRCVFAKEEDVKNFMEYFGEQYNIERVK